MTNEEAIKKITHVKYCYAYEGDYEAFDMAIEALEGKDTNVPTKDCISRQDAIRWVKTECNPYGKPTLDFESGKRVMEHLAQMPPAKPKKGWIPVIWHKITDEERNKEGYPKSWVVYIDCEMPSDEQEILVTTRWGTVEADICYEYYEYDDEGFGLDSGYDWIDDIIAWMPRPEPYKVESGDKE